jgi:hypothetical protein
MFKLQPFVILKKQYMHNGLQHLEEVMDFTIKERRGWLRF